MIQYNFIKYTNMLLVIVHVIKHLVELYFEKVQTVSVAVTANTNVINVWTHISKS